MHLLALEDMLVELLLQALVGEVDAQLLKAVLLEGLEPVDVQDPDRALGALPAAQRADLAIDGCNQPVKQAGIEVLCQRVPRGVGRSSVQLLHDVLAHRLDGPGRQGMQQGLILHLQLKRRSLRNCALVQAASPIFS